MLTKGNAIKNITSLLAVFLGFWLFWLGAANFSMTEETHGPAISRQEAVRIVLERFPNAQIKEIELDAADGRLVYEVELTTEDGHKKELRLNAWTGQIEKIEHD